MQPALTVMAVWLVPSEPDRAVLTRIIAALAKEHGAPVFVPHVTLLSGHFSGPVTAERCARVLGKAPARASMALHVTGVGHGDSFFRTAFLELACDDGLRALRERVWAAWVAEGHAPSERRFEPHLSLLYERGSHAERARIATRVQAPVLIRCDALAVVVPGSAGWEDVGAWQQVHAEAL
jgi:2'-5' RNA ligase